MYIEYVPIHVFFTVDNFFVINIFDVLWSWTPRRRE